MKTYIVLHQYDVDGGFGDAVSVKERICSFNNRADAEKFVEKYGCEHTYDHPYADLYCGKLTIIEEEAITFEEAEKLIENAWWREKKGE